MDAASIRRLIGEHFRLGHEVVRLYKLRNSHADGIDDVISACLRQIEIAPEAAEAFSCWGIVEIERAAGLGIRLTKAEAKSLRTLPTHGGYSRLCFVLEKQGRFVEAIEACTAAMKQGWQGDWRKRVARLKGIASP